MLSVQTCRFSDGCGPLVSVQPDPDATSGQRTCQVNFLKLGELLWSNNGAVAEMKSVLRVQMEAPLWILMGRQGGQQDSKIPSSLSPKAIVSLAEF